jgi:hypothetical protein
VGDGNFIEGSGHVVRGRGNVYPGGNMTECDVTNEIMQVRECFSTVAASKQIVAPSPGPTSGYRHGMGCDMSVMVHIQSPFDREGSQPQAPAPTPTCHHESEIVEIPEILQTPRGEDIKASAPAEECVICTDMKRQLTVPDCGHYCLCFSCAWKLIDRSPGNFTCPVCRRASTKKLIHTFV